ncbi:MAG: hypothetical protein GWO11_05460 [Desulfuromonadales bacterium]|nr:hypothetical protein [Desulfuromonadales bacterium]NIR33840.1 hypothetical protein [Desulfuromonadales bacterium]NIS42520.1 hypothetical protein [Desulfuromonadales bacterium]
MDEQRIAKEPRRIGLTLSDGRSLSGEVFLDLHDVHRRGSQRVGDLLNAEDFFLPVKTADGVFLVNIEQVMEVRVEAAAEKDELMLLGQRHTVRIHTVHGQEMIAELYVDRPQSSSRAKDYFNQPLRFFRVFQGDEVIYLNPANILYIRD